VAAIAAAIYVQINDLWRFFPSWIRTAVMTMVVVGVIVSIASWIIQAPPEREGGLE